MSGSTFVTKTIESAGDLVWRSVPATVGGWLAFRAEYDRLYKTAESLPGLGQATHAAYCRPDVGRLYVMADAPPEVSAGWKDAMKKVGVDLSSLTGCPVSPWPPRYGVEPWMLLRQSFDPRHLFHKKANAFPPGRFFASPNALAAALAGSVLFAGTGGLVKNSQYSETPLRDAPR